MSITIHTDGACLGNPGSGGWAYVIEVPGQHDLKDSGGFSPTTNNRMELYAIIAALQKLNLSGLLCSGTTIEIISDSSYVAKGVASVLRWRQFNWKTQPSEYNNWQSQPVENTDLWKKYLNACLFMQITGMMPTVKRIDRMTTEQNRWCDRAAKAAAKSPGLLSDPGYQKKP